MFDTKIKWVKFANDDAHLVELFMGRTCSPIKVNGKAVLLVNNEGEYHMVKNKCPHQGITLEKASCEDGKIICPWHHYGFDLKNGRGAGLYLDIYPIEKREDGYYAGFEYFSLF
ncbi:MAG: Rieske (2Fe-2S) protein [Crocinitomicaceae bacterium]|nr:Rieske (2Fe-2S) protein [Crocinitomicaceae bacterium]